MKASIVLVALLSVAVVGMPGRARAAGPVLVAMDRCNSQTLDSYGGQIRGDDAHPPADKPDALRKRFTEIRLALRGLNEERGILDGVCTTNAQKAQYLTQIGTFAALGLALESDIAAKLNLPCPAAARAVAQAFLAQGWLDLGSMVNSSGVVAPEVAQTAPKLQSRATALGLTLPVYADTSAYWRDQVNKQARAALHACATPVPSAAPAALAAPSPTPSPSPTPT